MSGAQLITYPDSLGGDLRGLEELFAAELAPHFPGGLHLLPPYPSSGDRGFAPLDYSRIDPRFGDWDDITQLAAHGGLTLDVMINHISRSSPEFRAFQRSGRAAPEADLFLTLDKVWPDGEPPAADVERIFLRKPDHPFSTIEIESTGSTERIWTTFAPAAGGPSEQIDLDVTSPATWALYRTWFESLARHGVTAIRLDAVGYVRKRAGTSCFMVEPEIWDFLDRVVSLAGDAGLAVLSEVHHLRPTLESLWSRGFTTYNFVLPGLILHGLVAGRADLVRSELQRCGPNQVTMLDCHDGIPVRPDLTGVLDEAGMRLLVDTCVTRGANISPLLGAIDDGEVGVHQLNVTYPSACGTEHAYLTARAIQLFAPGTPQVYYVGLLGGANDPAAVDAQGDRRAINRHDYSLDEARTALAAPVATAQLALLRLRATHPAFAGTFVVPDDTDDRLTVRWERGADWCELHVDMVAGTHRIVSSPIG